MLHRAKHCILLKECNDLAPWQGSQVEIGAQGRTAVENWLLVLGSGLVGSLVGLTWRLVQGFAVAEPVNKVLMAAIMVCMVLIVVLTSLDRPTDRANPAAA